MNPNYPQLIIHSLDQNLAIFKSHFTGISEEQRLWRPAPGKWNLHEIICHLYDEEREDFKARLLHVLKKTKGSFQSIDPEGWVKDRDYQAWDYDETLNLFLKERRASIEWLEALKTPNWALKSVHPRFGPLSAKFLLDNWLAHDFLHLRQITKLKYEFLKHLTTENLDYAGDW